MIILALDISMTSTGVSWWDTKDPDEAFHVHAIRPGKLRGLERYRYILSALDQSRLASGPLGLDLVVIEGYPYFLFARARGNIIKEGDATEHEKTLRLGGKMYQEKWVRTDAGQGPGNQVFGLAEITGLIKSKIHFKWDVPYACIAPTSIKKYATGNGRARKVDMIKALWDEHNLQFNTDDEVDAWYIGQMATDMILVSNGGDMSKLPKSRQEAISSTLKSNNPEGTWDWSNLQIFDKPFGRPKNNRRRRSK